MKRIAVAAEKSEVSGHFGLSEDFIYYDTDGKNITKVERFPNPGHRPCELPEKIISHGGNIDTVISGKLGKEAAKIFQDKGVEIIIGAKGEVKQIIDSYLSGDLHSTGEFCDAWTCEFFD